MKNFIRIVLAFVILLTAPVLSAYAKDGPFGHREGHLDFGVFLGPPWWGQGLWWPSPYYPYYPYYQQPPPEQGAPDVKAQTVPQAAGPHYLLYFCPEKQAYYPYVKECPRSWIMMAPPVQPPGNREDAPDYPSRR